MHISSPPMPSFCHNLSSHYAHLRTLTDEFETQYERVRDSGDLSEVRKLKIKLEEAREALLEQLCLFNVPDSFNPYHVALLEAGLDMTETRARQEMRVDIREEIQRQLAVYREVLDDFHTPALQEWIDDITKNERLLYVEIVKNRAIIEARIKAGRIPIVMPGRDVQKRTMDAVLTYVKPLRYERGKKLVVHPLHIGDVDIIETIKQTDFFNNIPDQPYLVWTKPTQAPDRYTCNKSFTDQQSFYVKLVRKYPDLYHETDIIPTEYMALQAIFTSSIKERYQTRRGSMREPLLIKPLDFDSHTRFLLMKRPEYASIPSVGFSTIRRGIGYDHQVSGPIKTTGFRSASRT